MDTLYSKQYVLICLLICYNISFAQKKILIKYYENNTKLAVEDVRMFLVTKTDTVILPIVKIKIRLENNMKDSFSLFAQFKGNTAKIGSYRPAAFEENDEIIIGTITDFSKLKTNWEFKDTFAIDTMYLIRIPNSHNIADVIYSIVVKYVDCSLNTDVADYIPTFTYWYETLKKKN